MKHLVGLCLALGLVACKQEVAASVVCKVAEGPTANCTITQTKGDAEFEVCWDFKVTCDNAATLVAAKTCAKVKDGGTTNAITPKEKITLTGECDKVKEATVTNMTIEGKPAQPQ